MKTPTQKVLILPLRKRWFDLIRDGKKSFEYRLANDYWKKRLVGKHYDTVAFTLGYPPRADATRRIEVPYRGYVRRTVTSAEWHNEPREVFAIRTGPDQNAKHTDRHE